MSPREPFGMFHVMVDPDSKFEKIFGIATMAPYFVICTLVVLIVRCRELMTITWLVGQLANEVGFHVSSFFLHHMFYEKKCLCFRGTSWLSYVLGMHSRLRAPYPRLCDI
jgi:hypothetical protein